MATINIANNTWQTERDTRTISITANSTKVKFDMGDEETEEKAWAKACVEIDTSRYKSITFKYSALSKDGNSQLEFGIYDDMTPNNASGTTVIGVNGWRKSGGSVSANVPSSSGIKYVGFRFYGNTCTLNDSVGWAVKQSVAITALTAVERGYTLTYNANGGSGGPSSVSDITSTKISSTAPTRDGYDFLGWSTSSYATSASYVAGNSISLSSNITLYAVWRKFYTVTYNANGGSNAPSSDKKINGQTLVLNSASPAPPTNTSISHTVTFDANGGTCNKYMETINHVVTYKFTNWNTKADGSGASYQPGGLYTNNSDITLYAQYAPTTTYNSITLPTPVRDNYDFLGWSINEYDISGTIGECIPIEDTTLYAIWKIRGQVYICDKLGGYSPYKVLIRDSSGWNQYVPYIYTYSGWEIYSG